ncbi:hypothetical protein GCM10025734_17720 [Kitasatospora paranensis]
MQGGAVDRGGGVPGAVRQVEEVAGFHDDDLLLGGVDVQAGRRLGGRVVQVPLLGALELDGDDAGAVAVREHAAFARGRVEQERLRLGREDRVERVVDVPEEGVPVLDLVELEGRAVRELSAHGDGIDEPVDATAGDRPGSEEFAVGGCQAVLEDGEVGAAQKAAVDQREDVADARQSVESDCVAQHQGFTPVVRRAQIAAVLQQIGQRAHRHRRLSSHEWAAVPAAGRNLPPDRPHGAGVRGFVRRSRCSR